MQTQSARPRFAVAALLGAVGAVTVFLQPVLAAELTALGLLAGMTLHASWVIVARMMRRARPCELIAATAVIAGSLIVVNGLLLGAFGGLKLRWMLALTGLQWLSARRLVRGCDTVWLRTRRRLAMRRERRFNAWAVCSCAAAVAAAAGLGLFDPQADYDAIGYHLTTAATWVQEGHTRLVPTPFGDNAQAYAPANFELIEAWLMLPFHADTLARAAQFPFLGLLMLAAYALGRSLAGKRRWSIVAPFVLLFCRHLLVQSGSAMVDVAAAAFVIAAVALAASVGRTGCVFTLFCSGLAMGLAVGTKSAVLALMVILVPLAAVLARRGLRGRWPRSVAVWALGLALCGTYWYARNVRLTGNPVYPLRVTVGERTILPGTMTREMMSRWLFNRSNLPDVWVAFSGTFTPLLGRPVLGPAAAGYAAWVLLWIAAIWVCGRRRCTLGVDRLATLLSVPLMLAVQWWVVPYQEPRFFFAAVGLVGIAAALVAGQHRWGKTLVGVALAIHLLLCAGWYVMTVALLTAGALMLGLRPTIRWMGSGLAGRLAMALVAIWLLAVLGSPQRARPKAFARHPRFHAAWSWADTNLSLARIAYAGHNIPYFWFGPRLESRVLPINVDEHSDFAFHDYAALDNAMTGARAISPEAAYYRATLDHRAWVENLRRMRVDYLVVTTVGENQMLTIRHDEEGFPMEARWAERTPPVFSLVYQDRHTRIYRIDREAAPADFEPPITRAEPDCFSLRGRDFALYRGLYPWAERRIARSRNLRALVSYLEQPTPAAAP